MASTDKGYSQFIISPQELASLHAKLEKTAVESVDLGHLLDSRLEAAIEELREKSEMEIAQYKLEVEATYKDKVSLSLSLSFTHNTSRAVPFYRDVMMT